MTLRTQLSHALELVFRHWISFKDEHERAKAVDLTVKKVMTKALRGSDIEGPAIKEADVDMAIRIALM